MPEPFRLSVSFAMLALPVPARFAPEALTELAHPLPAAPVLPQGQAVPVPSPKHAATNDGALVVRTNWKPLIEAKLEPGVTVNVKEMEPPAGTLLKWCSAYVTPCTCGLPVHGAPTSWKGSTAPGPGVTRVWFVLTSDAQA